MFITTTGATVASASQYAPGFCDVTACPQSVVAAGKPLLVSLHIHKSGVALDIVRADEL